jgi:hypothetical protein
LAIGRRQSVTSTARTRVELTKKSSTDARPNGADSTSEILQTRRPHVIVHRRLALAVKAKLFERFTALTPLAVGAR